MRIRKTIFGRQKLKPNTFIGGVSATINSISILASLLGISTAKIRGFKILGSDISCFVVDEYYLPGDLFKNRTDIKYWKDNKAFSINNGTFQNCTNLEILELNNYKIASSGGYPKITNTKIKTLVLPEITTFVGSADIQNNSLLEKLILPKATTMISARSSVGNPLMSFIDIKKVKLINGTPGYTGYFNTTATVAVGCVVNANIFMATCNGGLPDGDLLHIYNTRSGIINFYDDAGNYVSTL